MDTKLLRQKILDLAIRGKLVPQDPNDESASVLLEKIRVEKERLIREKKIKRTKKNSVDKPHYEKEVPFEVPESWVWVKIKDIFQINPKNDLDDNENISFIPMQLISDEFANEHKFEIRKWKDVKRGFIHFQEGDVAVAKITPCFENRKSVILNNLINHFGAGTTELHILRPILEPSIANYTLWLIKSEYFINHGISNFSGAVGQQRVGRNIIEETWFPLPPFSEQKRIVIKIERLFELIDAIEQDKTYLRYFITQTKSKVLDLAIRGKLVPQDPNDKPASTLLKQINKKLHKTTTDKSHYPFEAPDSWEWIELNSVLEYEHPTKYIVKSTEYSDTYSIPVLTAGKSFIIGHTDEKEGVYKDLPVIIFDDFTTSSKYVDFEFKVKSSAMKILRARKDIANIKYIAFFMSITRLAGNTHKRYWISEYSKIKIPLPPLAEQQRIVEKIEDTFKTLDRILDSLKAIN